MKLLKTLLLIVTVALLTMSAPAQSAGGSQKKTATTATATDTLVDINAASADELKALPGIGDKYSAKIIAGRPYASKSQLVSKNIIPQATYNKVQDKIIAKQKK
jgi:DNA uptake protein ComE-like DNA-binding protein